MRHMTKSSFPYRLYARRQGLKVVGLPNHAPRYEPYFYHFSAILLMLVQLKLLDELDLLEDGYSVPRFAPGQPFEEFLPEELVVLLRTLKLPSEELSRLQSKAKPPKPTFSMEEASLLATVVAHRQAEYPTTIEQDEQILQQSLANDWSSNPNAIRRGRMAVQVRKGEKEILALLSANIQDHLRENGTLKRMAADTPKDNKKQRTN